MYILYIILLFIVTYIDRNVIVYDNTTVGSFASGVFPEPIWNGISSS